MSNIDITVTPFCNHIGYTDVRPFEIIRTIGAKTLEIREMKATLAAGEKPEFIPGGFAGHCTNQHSLKYDIVSDEESPVIRVRLHKDGYYRSKGGRKFSLSATARKFYDYNF